MLTVPISLGGSRAYLATYGSHTQLPSGGTLVEPTDGQPIIVNSDGSPVILPPEQPTHAVPAPKPDSPHTSNYEAGHVRTDYILPIGLTTALAAVVLAAGMLTGTIGQIVRGINPGIPPPVAAANSRSSTDLDEIVEATSTPTPSADIWTPTPEPTYTPTPEPTATPIPDPLGIMPFYNVQMSGKNPEHTQAIIRMLDYVQQRLLGKNALGRTISVLLGGEEEYKAINKLYSLEPKEMSAEAYTFYSPASNKSTILITDQRQLVKIVLSACNEWVKPFIMQQNPRASILVVETAGLFGEVACYRALEELGYDFHKANNARGNQFYLRTNALLELGKDRSFGRDAVYGAWVIAEMEDATEAIAERRLLTADELVRLALLAGNQNDVDLRRNIDAYTINPDLVRLAALNKLKPGTEQRPIDSAIIRSYAYLAPS